MELLRPQALNAPILALAKRSGGISDDALLHELARERGIDAGTATCCVSMDAWKFSAMATLAKRRLLRYRLLQAAPGNRLTITQRGELFLTLALSKLDRQTRAQLEACHMRRALAHLEEAFARSQSA